MSTHTRLAKLEALAPPIALPTTIERLNTPADVLALLDQTIRDMRAGRLDPRTAAVIGGLAGVALKAMEVGDLADQLDALAAVLAPDKRRRLPERRR
jgi:hypothetical protein